MAGSKSARVKYTRGGLRADTRQLDKKIQDFVDQPLSDRLDAAFGTDRGTIIHRGENGWSALAPGTSGHFLKSNGAGADLSYAAINAAGRLVAGTPLVCNPVDHSSLKTQAHGLGVVPAYIDCQMECLSAENGYSAGDIIRISGMFFGVVILADATNVKLVTRADAFVIYSASSFAAVTTTASKWKITLIPYALTTS